MSISSGQFLLNATSVPASSTIVNATRYELCRVSESIAKPRVVQVSVSTPANESTANSCSDAHFFAGYPDALAGGNEFPYGGLFQQGLGGIVLDYGAGSASRRIVCDLRSGTYNLPPSSEVKVSLYAHRGNATTWTPAVTVAASISDGHMDTPTRPVYTVGQVLDKAPTNSMEMNVPNGARWVDFWASTATQPGSIIGGANASVLIVGPPSLDFPTPVWMKDYVTGTAFPHGGPYELMNQQQNESVLTLTDATAVVSWCFFRFFLEL